MDRRHAWLMYCTGLAWAGYLVLTLATPLSESSRQFGLNEINIALIRVSIAVPYLVAWLAGCYGGLTLLAIASRMAESEDRIAYRRIAGGIFVLVGTLILTSLIGAIRNYAVQGGPSQPTFAIITNYLYVFGPLAGLSLIFSGSGHLRRDPSAEAPRSLVFLGTTGLLLFAVVYLWLIFTNPSRTAPAIPGGAATYYLPDAAIVMTIALPFLAACLIGLLAAFRIARYYRGVNGYLYKRSAFHLVNGTVFLIVGSVLLQGLLSLGSERLLVLGLGGLLAVVYVFIGVQTFGFVSISLGAKKLSVIEQVMKKYEAGAGSPAVPKAS